MKRISQLMILCLLTAFVSCSDEEVLNDDLNVAAQELATDLSEYEGTSYGQYKGVFSTNDSQERGVVDIQVISEEYAKATLSIDNGGVTFFETVPTRNSSNELVLLFNENTTAFEFVVTQDGTDARIPLITYQDNPSSITVEKENTRDAIVTSTGTFTGSSAGGDTVDGTWNIIFDSTASAGVDGGFTTQIIFNGNDIGSSMGNVQENCTDDGSTQTCDVSGIAQFSENVSINFTGVHTSQLAMDCSSYAGTWSGAGGSTGTWSAGENCFECMNGTAAVGSTVGVSSGDNIITADNTAPVNYVVSVSETGTIGTDAGIENVTLNITHTFTGDVDIFLVSPTGTRLELSTDNGAGGDNFTATIFQDSAVDNITDGTAPFTGEFAPEGGSLNDIFDGDPITGNWMLEIDDDAGGDDGTLDSWLITFCDAPVSFPAPPPTQPGDEIAIAIPFTPLAEGTGCATETQFNVGGGLYTDSGLDSSCRGTSTGVDIFYTWTADSEELLFTGGAGAPGVVVRDATTQTEIVGACLTTFGNGLISGWALGQDLIIQVYDFTGADVTIGFCLEANTPPPPPECGGQLVDSGGLTNNYGVDDLIVETITAGAGETISLDFSVFDTESCCDFMRIFDGADTFAPEITVSTGGVAAAANGFSGNSLMGDSVVSTGNTITIEFDSDGSIQSAGYVADIVCSPGFTDTGDQITDASNTRAANRLTDQDLRNRKPLILNEDEKRELAQKNKQ